MSTAVDIYRSAIPPRLASQGVQMAEHGGYRAIVIPDDVRKRYNVLTPQSSIAAAVPLWTPAVRTVGLDIERHAYWHPQMKKFALGKPGLMELGDLAGVSFSPLRRLPRSGLRPTEIGWEVDVFMRGPDGTLKGLPPGARVIDEQDEYNVILDQCGGNEQKAKARWLNEKRTLDAKCQTMAVLRGIRAALRIPHGFTKDDLQKEFLVVAYHFSPDYSDPEVVRMLTEKGAASEAALWGSSAGERERVALPAAAADVIDVPAIDPRAADDYEPIAGEVVGDHVAGAADPWDADAAPAAQPAAPAPAAAQVADAAGATVLPYKKHRGKTIAQVAGEEPDYLRYLLGLPPRSPQDSVIQERIRDYMAATSGQKSLS